MGYRSEVTVAIGFPDDDAMVAFVTERRLSGAINEEQLEPYNVMEGCSYTNEQSKICTPTIMYAHFEYVKWYEGYEDVDMHMGMIEKAKSLGLPTYYARIGEDYGDIECDAYDEAWVDDDTQIKFAKINVDWFESGFGVARCLEVPAYNDQWTIKEALQRRETDEQPRETIESQDAVSS